MNNSSNEFVACGWFTPDYSHWAAPLKTQLEERGIHHDFVSADKQQGGWELNTLAKASHVLAAMDRHPGKTILFLDVDCQIIGTRTDIDKIVNISGDTAFFARIKLRHTGKPVFSPRSGTMVFRPTANARNLVEEWVATSRTASRYAVDQDSLVAAVGRVPNLSITLLGIEACAAVNDEVTSPVILHNIASEGTRTGAIKKLVSNLLHKI